jgi:hypothetical protein
MQSSINNHTILSLMNHTCPNHYLSQLTREEEEKKKEKEYVGNLNLNIMIVARQAYAMHCFAKLIVLHVPFH